MTDVSQTRIKTLLDASRVIRVQVEDKLSAEGDNATREVLDNYASIRTVEALLSYLDGSYTPHDRTLLGELLLAENVEPEDDEPEDDDQNESTYTVWCHFQDRATDKQRIETGLTLEQAQAICQDPDTSSTTTTTAEGKQRTETFGAWFYGYTED